MTAESGFSGQVDHFSMATTEGDYLLKLHSSSTTPPSESADDALDADGNMADRGYYLSGPGTPVECVYKLVSGTLDLSDLGPVGLGTNLVIASIGVVTSNGEWPTVTVGGILYTSPPATLPTFTLPVISISGLKSAQVMGFAAVGTAVRLTGSSLTLSGEIHHVLSDKDTVGNIAFTGGVLVVTGSYTALTGAPTVTAAAPIAAMEITQSATYSAGITGWTEGGFEGQLHQVPDA